MKNNILIIILLAVIFMAACNNNNEHKDHQAHTAEGEMADEGMDHAHMDHSQHESMGAGDATDMSLYNLSSQWTTQESKKLELKNLSGKVQVVSMAYTTCQFACPRIVADLKRIQKEIEEKGLQDEVNYVLVSIDPKVDTPERLKEFAKENKMSPENWTLLNGEDGDILELAAMLGVKYKKTTEKDYAHSNIITVLDKNGEIAYQQEGLGQEPKEVIKAIERIVGE